MKIKGIFVVLGAAAILGGCGGGGGDTTTAAQTPQATQITPVQSVPAAKLAPISVAKSSYENKMQAAFAIGPQSLPFEVETSNSVAFADFFQDGTYSMMTATLVYNSSDPSTANQIGKFKFYKKVNGAWVDNTTALLSDTTGCLHPRKSIVADFNGDKKPDVFISCTGFDNGTFPGEQPRVLLSQADGTYKNVLIPIKCYCHGAAAADFNNDGYADILVTNNTVDELIPFFLKNNHDGTFSKDLTRISKADLMGDPINGRDNFTGSIFTAELIDFDKRGLYDAFLGGDEPPAIYGNWHQTIFKNDGSNKYSEKVVLPGDPQYTTALDIVFANGNIYFNRVHITGDAAYYGYSAFQKINYETKQSTTIYQSTANPGKYTTWINWIIPYEGKIVTLNSDYGISVPQ